jgi:hypothetical protein
MEPGWLITLAAGGGSALVGAVATDAWQLARGGLTAVFGRAGARRQELAAGQADETAAQIEAAPEADRAAVQERWARRWQDRLVDFLAEFPEAEDELRAWAASVRAQLPAQQQNWVNLFIARDNATQYNAPGGSITVHHHGDGGARS